MTNPNTSSSPDPSGTGTAHDPLTPRDRAFVECFESCELPLKEWAHNDHVKLAYCYLLEHGFDGALERLERGIHAINEVHGVPYTKKMGFHATFTGGWLSLVKIVLDASGPSASAGAFIDDHPELTQPKTLRLFYSFGVLGSREAKESFLEPDLARFPASSPV